MSSVYFGGSRHLGNAPSSLIQSVVRAVVASGQGVHVGCQRGADAQVLYSCSPSSLVVFAVAPSVSVSPAWVQLAYAQGSPVHFSAGGSSAPVKARFLLRSLAGLQGCSAAVFFSPGAGSLAVAAHAVQAGIPVFAFGSSIAIPPGCAGVWVPAQFQGFSCWQFKPAQLSFF